MSDIVESKKTLSSMWYLMPFFLGVIGGLIVWITKKDQDPAKAKRILVLGIALSAVHVAISAYSQIVLHDVLMNIP